MFLSAYDKLLSNLAQRFGINNPKTIRKSKELLTLLGPRDSLNCSDTCKTIVCLELAASLTSVDFSREIAVKLSGCTKRNYVNNFNNISKLLNLDKIYTIREISVLVGVPQVCDAASNLLKKYKTVKTVDPSDLEHPMYGCAAVFAVCRKDRISLNLTKLIEISRVKKANLKKLTDDFIKLYENKSNENSIADSPENVNVVESMKKRKYNVEDKIEEEMTEEKFQDWKRKMLGDN